jgi:hypothetical protein
MSDPSGDDGLDAFAVEMVPELLDLVRGGRRKGQTAVPILMKLSLRDQQTMAIVHALKGPDEAKRIESRHRKGEGVCVLSRPDVTMALPVLCRLLTPELGAILSQKLPRDGCWLLELEKGRVSVVAVPLERPGAPYVRKQILAVTQSPRGEGR